MRKTIGPYFSRIVTAHPAKRDLAPPAEELYREGMKYYEGAGVPQDYQKAAELYRKAAERGHAGAQYELGLCYRNGKGVPRDVRLAVEWICLAAEQGHRDARYELSSG